MKYIIFLDFLSPRPNLKIDRSSRYKTLLGSIISIITYILIIITGGYFINELLTRSSSSITYNIVPSLNVSKNLSNLPYMIMLKNNYFSPIENQERFYFIHSEIWTTQNKNESGVVTTRTVIQQEPCDINKHFGEYRVYFESVPYLQNHLCPVPGQNNISLFGVYGSNGDYSYLTHYISKCVNNSIYNNNFSNCFDNETIYEKLENTFVSFKFLEFSLDHNSVGRPGVLTLRSEALPVSSTIFKREWFYVRSINYSSDLGLVFEDFEVENYFQVSSPKETVDLRAQGTVPGSFAMVTMIMDSQVDFYSRNFMKAQNLLANLGGIVKGLVLISQVLTKVFVNELYYLELVTTLFKIKHTKPEKERVNMESQQNMQSGLNHVTVVQNINNVIKINKVSKIDYKNQSESVKIEDSLKTKP